MADALPTGPLVVAMSAIFYYMLELASKMCLGAATYLV